MAYRFCTYGAKNRILRIPTDMLPRWGNTIKELSLKADIHTHIVIAWRGGIIVSTANGVQVIAQTVFLIEQVIHSGINTKARFAKTMLPASFYFNQIISSRKSRIRIIEW